MAEGSKPPSVRSSIRLSVRTIRRATLAVRTCTGEDSPFQPFSPVGVAANAATRGDGGAVPCLRWVNFPLLRRRLPFARGSHTSSVGERGLVSVPEPAVSHPGFAPGHLPDRWGDFPHVSRGYGEYPGRDTEAGLPLPLICRSSTTVSGSVGLREGETVRRKLSQNVVRASPDRRTLQSYEEFAARAVVRSSSRRIPSQYRTPGWLATRERRLVSRRHGRRAPDGRCGR